MTNLPFMLNFNASPALYEDGGVLEGSAQPDSLELGPYPCDKVMLTYDMLRVGEQGEEIAWLVDGLWKVGKQTVPAGGRWTHFGPAPDGPVFSDVVIYVADPNEQEVNRT